MKKIINIIVFLLLSVVCWAGGSKDTGKASDSNTQQQKTASASPYYTGDGGKGMSIAILAPQSKGLTENQSYLPALVQGEFVSNFSGFSAVSVLDRQRLDAQYAELLSGYYDDNAKAGLDLGHLTPTDYIMGGDITRTATGYSLQMQITKTSDKMTTASYSGTFTFSELDNLTGIRKASLDLLQKMGVKLTAKAHEELTKGAAENNVSAQTALAKGITAQRQGTEVAALSYYFQAATFDPSLTEALSRSSILNANISSGNIGDNVRNDIQWRKDWVARLTETEQYFDSFNKTASMPYTLFYVDEINQVGEIDYRNETITLSVNMHLHGSSVWTLSIERALQAVYDGLDATKRKDVWGLGNWPQQEVTKLNAFAKRSGNFSVVFELLNNNNKVIGRQTLQTGGYWELNRGGRPEVNVNADDKNTLNFQKVNANDITDKMTIRVVTVNGTAAETAARNGILQIRAISKKQFDSYGYWRFAKGELQGFVERPQQRQGYYALTVPDIIWGDQVISIGKEAFSDMPLSFSNIIISEGIKYIGERAFAGNEIRELTIHNSVISIGDNAFLGKRGVKYIANTALSYGSINTIIIGANVNIAKNAFNYFITGQKDGVENEYSDFVEFYNKQGKKAGRYERPFVSWKYIK